MVQSCWFALHKGGGGRLACTYAGLIHDVTDTDCQAQNCSTQGSFSAVLSSKGFYKFQTLIFNEQDEKSRENDCA